MKVDWGALAREMVNWTGLDVGKVLLSAVIIGVVTKVQVVSDRLSALLIALPLTSVLAMIWMRAESEGNERIANHAEGTFWFVVPTLPMFLVLPWMLRKGWPFGWSLVANCVMTAGLFWVMVMVLRKVGMKVI
ncbi:MAG: DUF3147 family protein [Verrucomicrobiota bacterium]